MRNGSTVEITNTDAEGRLILADALADADAEEPALLLDAATLTGAARVAVGPGAAGAVHARRRSWPRICCGRAASSSTRSGACRCTRPISSYMKSPVADLANASSKPFAGAITAALFLKEFVKQTRAWAHLDLFAWNDDNRPGRPRGGEAIALRPLLALIEARFGAGRG